MSLYCAISSTSSAPWLRRRATTSSMSSTANMMRRMPSAFAGAPSGSAPRSSAGSCRSAPRRAAEIRRGCREIPRRRRSCRFWWAMGTWGATARPCASGRGVGEAVVVELQEVVGGRDEPPFASACGPASALEASDLAVELDLAEHRLDGDLALAIEGAPSGRGEHTTHEVIEAAGPAGTGALAQAGVGRHEHLDAVADDRVDLALMPVARVAQHDLGVTEIDGCELAPGGA